MIRKALLPSEYQEVEYIVANGSGQYIDTGVPANNDNLSFKIKYKFNALSAGTYQYIIGAWTNESTNSTRLLQYGLDITYLNVNTKPSGGTTAFAQTRNANTIYEDTLSNTQYTSNGSTQAITATTTGTTYSGNVLLFKANPTTTSAFANVRLYYFEIYDNGVLIRNMIPCYRKSDSVIGLYDTINGIFYVNIGTSSFTKGNDIPPRKIKSIYKALLPREYQQVEYIESTGTQYIDTGYSPNNNSKMWLDYQPTSAQSTMYAGARHTEGSSSSSSYGYFTINSGASNTLMYAAFSSSGNVELGRMTTNRVQTQIGVDGIYYNNVKKHTPSSRNFQLNEKVILFAVMQNGTEIALKASVKIYGCKIWESDVIQRHFIPCYRISDNVIGMYDLANRVFYTNNGTGTFTKGNNVETTEISRVYKGNDIVYYKIPSEYQEVDYIESSGGQYIDTGLEGKNGYTMDTKVVFTNFASTYNYIAGFATSSSNRVYFTRTQRVSNSEGTDGWTFDGDSHNLGASVPVVINTEYVYKSIMKSGEQKLYRNGVLLGSGTRTDNNSYGTIWLFASNYNGGMNGAVSCKMYCCKFTYNNKLVRYFVPCYRKSDDEIGMYDIINKVFYTNSGSDSFTKGNDI